MSDKPRNAPGEGSVFQRKDGRWVAELYLGKDDQGKRKVWRAYADTPEDARAALRKALGERDRGRPILVSRQTLAEYLADWLENTVKPQRRPYTFEGYEVNVRCHIVPQIGQIRLDQLAPQHVQGMVNRLGQTGLSARSVQYVHATLRVALEQAVLWELLPRNVASLVKVPSVPEPEHSLFSADEAKRLLAAVEGHRLEALYVVTLALGLRQGEVLGLRWVDVDLAAGVVSIRQQLQHTKGEWRFSAPKSRHGTRAIPLPDFVTAALVAHRERQQGEVATHGWSNEYGLVFLSRTGTPIDGSNLTHRFQALCAENDLPVIPFHALRHTCGTLLEAMGVPLSTVRDILGHASLTTTARYYVHGVPALSREAMNTMQRTLRAPKTAPESKAE